MPQPSSSPVSAWLQKISGASSQETVAQVLSILRSGDILQAAKLLDKSNQSTRQSIWMQAAQDEHIRTHALPALIMDKGADQKSDIKRYLLDTCLTNGWVSPALHLIAHGAPTGPDIHLDGGDRNPGPMARLMYDEYPAVPSSSRAQLAIAMMEKNDITRFNPALIARYDVMKVFLNRAPDPQDEAWHAFVWRVNDLAREQVRSETDPRNAPALLAAGYPGVPIDLVARALAAGSLEHALELIKWTGSDLPTRNCEGLVSAFDMVTEEPVLAAGFWHALADSWASGVVACKTNGWAPSELRMKWPTGEVLELLLKFKELDPCALDDEGLTPAQRAIRICGEPGPVLEVKSRQQSQELSAATPEATTLRHRSPRL